MNLQSHRSDLNRRPLDYGWPPAMRGAFSFVQFEHEPALRDDERLECLDTVLVKVFGLCCQPFAIFPRHDVACYLCATKPPPAPGMVCQYNVPSTVIVSTNSKPPTRLSRPGFMRARNVREQVRLLQNSSKVNVESGSSSSTLLIRASVSYTDGPSLQTIGGMTTLKVLSVAGVMTTSNCNGVSVPVRTDCIVTFQVPTIVGDGVVGSGHARRAVASTESPGTSARLMNSR